MEGPAALRVLTWNVFHAHDGLPGLGPDWRSTLLGVARDDGTHLHVNRTLVRAVGGLIRRAAPDVAMLQEVPPWAVGRIAAAAGMTALHALTAPRVGPACLREAPGRLNPDLIRTHEGNANALLVRAPWAFCPGTARRERLNPGRLVARVARARGLPRGAALNWWWERRGLLTARVRHPSGPELEVACCHLHTDVRVNDAEAARAAALLRERPGPLVLGGDLNARPGRDGAVFSALAAAGLSPLPWRDGPARGIDHILVRGVRADRPARAWSPRERDVTVPWRGGTRLVRVSDHDPVEAVVGL